MARKMSPEERRALRAEWAETRRDFDANYKRLQAKWRADDERRERRRRLVRLPLRLVGRA